MQENGTAVQIIEQRRQDTANALQELAAEEKELLRRRESLAGQVQAVAEEIAHGEAELAGRKKDLPARAGREERAGRNSDRGAAPPEFSAGTGAGPATESAENLLGPGPAAAGAGGEAA